MSRTPAARFLTRVDELVEYIESMPTTVATRRLIALAGPPGSGKSTLARSLADALDRHHRRAVAAVVAMDGFHLDDRLLRERGWRAEKGAPHTFDAAGFEALLRRVRADRLPVCVPVFDRELELSRNAAAVVDLQHRIVIVEGNWLLLQSPPWRQLHELFDLTVRLEVDEAVLSDRLYARWRHYRLDEAAARQKVEQNDLPNARLVREGSIEPDILFRDA